MTTSTYPWSRFYMPHSYAPSLTGEPLPGALLYFYESGTSTPLDTFSDDALSIPNANPVEADQYGVFGDIFLQQQSYRAVLTDADGDEVWSADPVAPFVPTQVTELETVAIVFRADNNGYELGTGVCGDCYVPFGMKLTSCVLQADQAGDLELDVWAAPFVAGTPPTSANSIVASAPPTLTTSQSSIDTTLTGWDTEIAEGTAFRFNITSITTILRFTLTLSGTRTSTT